MKKVSINEYARMTKKSIFAVVKDIQTGKLQSIEEEVDGIKKRFVIVPKEPTIEAKIDKSSSLEDEIKELKDEIRELKSILRECCNNLRGSL